MFKCGWEKMKRLECRLVKPYKDAWKSLLETHYFESQLKNTISEKDFKSRHRTQVNKFQMSHCSALQ